MSCDFPSVGCTGPWRGFFTVLSSFVTKKKRWEYKQQIVETALPNTVKHFLCSLLLTHKFILFRGERRFVKEDTLTGYHQNPISSCLRFRQASQNWTLCESSHPSVVWALTETHRSIYAELNTAGHLCCLSPSDSPALSRCSPLAPSFGHHGPVCFPIMAQRGPAHTHPWGVS